MTSVHFPSNYPIWSLWDPIAWEPRIPFSSEQKVLLFAAATIRHGDRKQILIIIWTHREKKKSLMGHNEMSQCCKTGGSLCPFPVPRNVVRLVTRGGVGEVNDITGCAHIWILTQWHLVFLFSLHLPAISSLKPGLCLALPFLFPPQRIPPFLFLLLSSCLRMKWRKWHSISWWMVLDPWNPAPVGLTQRRIYISQEISRTHLFTSGKNKSPTQRCCKWRLNICWSTSAVNWTTFTGAFFPLSSRFLVWHTSALVGLPHWEPFCYMINYSEQQLWRD